MNTIACSRRFELESSESGLTRNLPHHSRRASRSCSLLAALGIAILTSDSVGAAELYIYWDRLLQPSGGENDLFVDGGGSTSSGLMLQSGLNVATSTYHVDYASSIPEYEPYADMASLAGGTVSYGYLSGLVSTSASTTAFLGDGPNAYAHLIMSWTDTMTISNPALTGQYGVMNGNVLLDASATINTIGSSAPNDEAAGWVTGIFKLNDSNTYDFTLTDGDEFAQYGSVPASLLVPISVGFIYGDPFDFGMGFYAESASTARSADTIVETHADATLNFLSTVAWQGISSVQDSQGNVVAFELISESGTNWTQAATNPVPIPASVWLFGSGLLGLIGISRRKHTN